MKKITILCVDDDSDDLQLLNETLKDTHADFEVIEAHNGRQALDLLQNLKKAGEHPSLIILDINMPVLNGKEIQAPLQALDGAAVRGYLDQAMQKLGRKSEEFKIKTMYH